MVALSLAGGALHLLLRIPNEQQARSGAQRPLTTIAAQPTFAVAVLAGTVGYAVMILVMTATPLAMRTAGFDLADPATVMQWHVLGMFAPPSSPAISSPATGWPGSCSPAPPH
jgi:hypothetical protein